MKTKSIAIKESGVWILITEIPNHMTRDEVIRIAVLKRREYDCQQHILGLALFLREPISSEEISKWKEKSSAKACVQSYIENPVLITDYDEYLEAKNTNEKAVYAASFKIVETYLPIFNMP